MANNHVLGKNIVVEMFNTELTQYEILFCAKSMSFEYNQDEIESTSFASPFDREYEPGLGNATLTLNGVTTTTNADNRLSPFHVFKESIRRTKQLMQIVFLDQNNDITTLRFHAIFTKNAFSSDVLSWSQCAINMRISGGVEILSTIEIPVGGFAYDIYSDWWTTTPSNTYVPVGSQTSAVYGFLLTAADDVIEIDREGGQVDEVLGTPVNRQATFNTSLLRVEVDPTNPFNTGDTIFILFKRPNNGAVAVEGNVGSSTSYCLAPNVIYYTYGPFAVGNFLFYDAALNNPVLTFTHFTNNAISPGVTTFFLNPATGEITGSGANLC